MNELNNNKIEWTVAIPAHLQSINVYTQGAWLYGDEADESNTCIISESFLKFAQDYENGNYSRIYEYVEKTVEDYGFTIVGDWNGLTTKAIKVNNAPEKKGLLKTPSLVSGSSTGFEKFVDSQNIENNAAQVLSLLFNYSHIDGSHHKQWLFDQIVRSITGEKYDDFVKNYETDEITGDEYDWDIGIAP